MKVLKKLKLKLLLVLSAIILSSCASKETVFSPVLLPPEPTYVKIDGGELSCLSKETYVKLVKRTQTCTAYVSRLQKLIEDHNNTNKNRE